jgi:hypothetical protein
MKMTITEYFAARAIAIAGSTFALGLTLGWILAILHLGGSSGSSHRRDRDED